MKKHILRRMTAIAAMAVILSMTTESTSLTAEAGVITLSQRAPVIDSVVDVSQRSPDPVRKTRETHIETEETETIEPFEDLIPPEELIPETEPEPEPVQTKAGIMLSMTDQNMLMRIAMAEAEDQGVEGMALVMNVVLNRVNSSAWPNTVEGVIFQTNQFEPIRNGRYDRMTPNAKSEEALNMVLSGWDESQGAEYFCMAGSSKWHENNLTRLFQYKDHVFYR